MGESGWPVRSNGLRRRESGDRVLGFREAHHSAITTQVSEQIRYLALHIAIHARTIKDRFMTATVAHKRFFSQGVSELGNPEHLVEPPISPALNFFVWTL